jgi:hypothetical protein
MPTSLHHAFGLSAVDEIPERNEVILGHRVQSAKKPAWHGGINTILTVLWAYALSS